MRTNLLRLLVLGALWGASFPFLRAAVPALGPVALIAARVSVAAVALVLLARFLRRDLGLARKWRAHLVVGVLNSALPFVLFAYAARSLDVATLAVLNATAPVFGAVVGAVASREAPGLARAGGLALGVTGVAVLLGFDASAHAAPLAVAASLAAACSYGVASVVAKARASDAGPLAGATGSMIAAAAVLVPLAPLFPPSSVTLPALGAVVALGVACTALAYVLYFDLVARMGPAALTVTFLVPLFATAWGALFLGEPVRASALAGGAVVLAGTALVTRGR